MREHLANGNPVEAYRAYLSRYTRSRNMTLQEANKLLLNRLIAAEYGVTKEQLLWLDENL